MDLLKKFLDEELRMTGWKDGIIHPVVAILGQNVDADTVEALKRAIYRNAGSHHISPEIIEKGQESVIRFIAQLNYDTVREHLLCAADIVVNDRK